MMFGVHMEPAAAIKEHVVGRRSPPNSHGCSCKFTLACQIADFQKMGNGLELVFAQCSITISELCGQLRSKSDQIPSMRGFSSELGMLTGFDFTKSQAIKRNT